MVDYTRRPKLFPSVIFSTCVTRCRNIAESELSRVQEESGRPSLSGYSATVFAYQAESSAIVGSIPTTIEMNIGGAHQ